MAHIEGNCREVCEAADFLTLITQGDDGPHVVGNWGDYLRRMGLTADTLVLPAGGYHKTEANLAKDSRIQVLIASHGVQGTRSKGQGYLIRGTGRIVSTGEMAEKAKSLFPWARGALVIEVKEVKAQL